LINMAITEKHLDRRDSLHHYLWKALTISKEISNREMEAQAMINLGNLHQYDNTTDSALYYFEEALILSEVADRANVVVIYVGFADIYIKTGDTAKALDYLKRAEVLSLELRSIDYLKRIYADMAIIYASTGDYRQAYIFQNAFFEM